MPSFNAKRFRSLADAAGDTTLDAIRQRTGIDTGLLSRLLRGERKPSFDTLTAAADGYKVPVDELIDRGAAA